jgi:hypothetical protein
MRLDMYVVHVQIVLVCFINTCMISFQGVQMSALPSYPYDVYSVHVAAAEN